MSEENAMNVAVEKSVEEENKKKKAAKGGASGVKGKSESGEKVVKKPGKLVATVESEPGELLKWIAEGGQVVFDKDDLPKLSDEELEKFPYGAVKQYKEERAKAEREAVSGISDIETLSGNAGVKLRLRKRRGWHQTWKRPDEFEDALEKGYVQIREAKSEGEKPGQEKGPVKKIMKGQGDVELIAMEVSQERYDRHVKAISEKSQRAYKSNKEGFAGAVEQFNRSVPKDSRAKVVDDEGDVS